MAIQAAFIALPLIALAFCLLDISRATYAKQQLQDSLDAATLLAARSTATTDADLAAVGAPALQENLNGYTVTAYSFHAAGPAIQSTASVDVTPIIANLWFGGDMHINVSSVVVRTINKVEVALVLDNTGSMAQTLGSGAKITALKNAANGLVDTLSAAAARSTDPQAVKFSVVPFNMAVNVGSGYQNASWMSGAQPAAYGADNFDVAGTNRFTLLSQLGLSWAGCVEARPAPYDTQDTAPNAGNPATLFVPYFAPDEPDNNTIPAGGGYYYYYYNNWITNDQTPSAAHHVRQANTAKYAASNAGAVASGASGVGNFGPNRECGTTSLMRLTTDANAVKAKLNSMVAVGNTNVAQGLIWGWHTLSPNAPFADGAAYGTPHTDKVIILLTDGDNTNNDISSGGSNNPNASIYTGLGYIGQGRLLDASLNAMDESSSGSQRRDAIDSRELLTCANMKAQNIIIYSIGVGVSAHSRTVLQTCASGTDHYYDVTDSAQLNSVFNAIAGAINNLRISH